MGSAGFHDPPVFFLQPQQGPNQPIHRREHPVLQCQGRRDVHGGGEGIVGGLGHVDVVVGMQKLPPGQGVAPTRDDLVGVHIGLGAGAGLPHHQGEIVIQCPGHHLVADPTDDVAFFLLGLFSEDKP